MPRIVRYDLMDCGNRFLHRRKWQQPFPDRKDGRETGILDNDGPASGQVAGGALTEPARLTLNIAVLGHAPFGHRRLDILAIAVVVRANLLGVDHAPSVLDEQPLRL